MAEGGGGHHHDYTNAPEFAASMHRTCVTEQHFVQAKQQQFLSTAVAKFCCGCSLQFCCCMHTSGYTMRRAELPLTSSGHKSETCLQSCCQSFCIERNLTERKDFFPKNEGISGTANSLHQKVVIVDCLLYCLSAQSPLLHTVMIFSGDLLAAFTVKLHVSWIS